MIGRVAYAAMQFKGHTTGRAGAGEVAVGIHGDHTDGIMVIYVSRQFKRVKS